MGRKAKPYRGSSADREKTPKHEKFKRSKVFQPELRRKEINIFHKMPVTNNSGKSATNNSETYTCCKRQICCSLEGAVGRLVKSLPPVGYRRAPICSVLVKTPFGVAPGSQVRNWPVFSIQPS